MNAINLIATCLAIACLSIAPVIDGVVNDGEWTELTDPIPLYQAGNPDKPMLAELRLGGWINGRLYGLVQGVDSHRVHACSQPEEYWIKLNDAAYVLTLAFINEEDCLADGFEFSTKVEQGNYTLVAHANFDKARDTGQTPETDICIYCPPTAVIGNITNASAQFTRPGQVMLKWTQDTIADLTLITYSNNNIIGAVHCERECTFVDNAAPRKAAYNLVLVAGRLTETFGPYVAGWTAFMPLVPMGKPTK